MHVRYKIIDKKRFKKCNGYKNTFLWIYFYSAEFYVTATLRLRDHPISWVVIL